MSGYFDKPDGIACRICGCTDTRLIDAGKRWGRPWATYKCEHCGTETASGSNLRPKVEPEGVEFMKTPCPECSTTGNVVLSTRGKVRYHRCNDCGHRFKSVEFVG